jgi:hypothetical protein
VHGLGKRHHDGIAAFGELFQMLANDGFTDNASVHRHIDEEKIRAWMCDHQLILFPLPPYSWILKRQ